MRRAVLVILTAVIEALAFALPSRAAAAPGTQQATLEADLPRIGRSNYVGSASCRSCHPDQHASWHRSYHRTMTQAATPENVLGDFAGTRVVSEGLDYKVGRDGDAFWAEMPDPDVMMYVVQGGRNVPLDRIPRVRRPVVMTTGSHHYQTYWVASERHDRLLHTLPLVYLMADRRWIPREAAFMRGPNDEGRFITQWNHHCIRCHSTGGNPGLDDATGQLRTEVAELGISCEACHGPAEEHVRHHRAGEDEAKRQGGAKQISRIDPTIVNPAKLDHRLSSHVCGQCHGAYIMRTEHAMEYARHGPLFRPGEDLDKTRYYIQYPRPDSPPDRWEEFKKNPGFFKERWWEDGTILAGGREYTAMSASGCYTRGEMSCLSCHTMHDGDPVDQLKPAMTTSAACTQCHGGSKYTTEIRQHTFHAPASSGSDCLNCHMPHTTYALFKAIRSHQIESPQILSSARHGVPNACNLCHLDRTLAWTGEHLSKWYAQPVVDLTEEQRTVSAALLWMLKGHAAQRVIAGWHVGWAPAQAVSGADWLAPFQAELLNDPYGVVRHVAGDSLRRLPGFADFGYDFLSSTNALATGVSSVQEHWRRNRLLAGRTGPEILVNPDGTVMTNRVAALKRAQDQRSITISE